LRCDQPDLGDDQQRELLPQAPVLPRIIRHAVFLYHRFCSSLGDVEELLAKRGIIVCYETIRQLDEVFVETPDPLLRDRSFKEWSAATAA
jgi:hypothetical protein